MPKEDTYEVRVGNGSYFERVRITLEEMPIKSAVEKLRQLIAERNQANDMRYICIASKNDSVRF